MRPGNLSSSAESQLWNSPTLYVFGGLAAMMGLIAIALIMLACSHCTSSDSNNNNNNNSTSKIDNLVVLDSPDREPKVMVVIMAGDDKPSCLAKPSVVLNSSTSMAPSQSSGYLRPIYINNQE